MSYQPQFTITPALVARVESIAALCERIQGAAVHVPWIPALQRDTRACNTHSSTALFTRRNAPPSSSTFTTTIRNRTRACMRRLVDPRGRLRSASSTPTAVGVGGHRVNEARRVCACGVRSPSCVRAIAVCVVSISVWPGQNCEIFLIIVNSAAPHI